MNDYIQIITIPKAVTEIYDRCPNDPRLGGRSFDEQMPVAMQKVR
jgi:hypothetical protein